VTPAWRSLPLVDRLNVPAPLTLTTMDVGTQAAVSLYQTEKVKIVAVVPVPGATRPLVRVVTCDAPTQLAA